MPLEFDEEGEVSSSQPSRSQSEPSGTGVSVRIIDAVEGKLGTPENIFFSHTLYEIEVNVSSSPFLSFPFFFDFISQYSTPNSNAPYSSLPQLSKPLEVYRNESPTKFQLTKRFNQFEIFHARLSVAHPDIKFPPLPEKDFFGRFTPDTIQQRCERFNEFLTLVSEHPVLSTSPYFLDFLELAESLKIPVSDPLETQPSFLQVLISSPHSKKKKKKEERRKRVRTQLIIWNFSFFSHSWRDLKGDLLQPENGKCKRKKKRKERKEKRKGKERKERRERRK